MNNEAHDYSLDPVRGPSSMLGSMNNTNSNKKRRILMRKWSNMELKALHTVRNSLHQLYYYISHTVLWILACLCEVLQFAPVRRTQCFPLRRCFYVKHREAGRARPGRTRLGSYSFHVIFQEGVINFGGAASESQASLSLQQQCARTCAHWGYFHPSCGSR